MTKHLNDDDFEVVNGKRILKDGRTLRVRLPMMDSVQQGVARHFNDARQRAYDSYENDLVNAWQQDASKKKRKYYDPAGGTVIEAEGEESGAAVGDRFFASADSVQHQIIRDSEGGIFRPQRVRAFDGSNLGLHRPGVRLPAGSPDMIAGLQADRAEALRLADLAAESAWVGNKANTPTGFGSGQVRAEQEGDPCTRDGYPGVLVEGEDGKLYCKIHEYVRQDAARRLQGYDPQGREVGRWDETEEDDEDETPRRRRRRNPDDIDDVFNMTQTNTETTGGTSANMPRDSLSRMVSDHQAKMRVLYDQLDQQTREAWRK